MTYQWEAQKRGCQGSNQNKGPTSNHRTIGEKSMHYPLAVLLILCQLISVTPQEVQIHEGPARGTRVIQYASCSVPHHRESRTKRSLPGTTKNSGQTETVLRATKVPSHQLPLIITGEAHRIPGTCWSLLLTLSCLCPGRPT